MSMWVMSTCICGIGAADNSPLFKMGSGTGAPPNEQDEDSEDPVDDLPETILFALRASQLENRERLVFPQGGL